jgi:hypothetical protein
MKRPRQESLPTLGATELAAGLHGTDARQACRMLQRFTQVVRHQRRLAFPVLDHHHNNSNDSASVDSSDDDHEEEEEESDAMDNEEQQQRQKFRKTETWKEDTADYQVPFVGTSTARGDTGRVVLGQWPTGLLESYLKKSPYAVELTNDTFIPNRGWMQNELQKKKDRKLSAALYKAYLKALGELVTAAIPIRYLQQMHQGSMVHTSTDAVENDTNVKCAPFVKAVMAQFRSICNLIQQECKGGKDEESAPCSPYVLIGLRLLHRLTLTSRSARIQIVKYFGTSGIWRYLFTVKSGMDPSRQKARVFGLQFLHSLVSLGDPILLDILASPGSYHDTTTAPGALYVALQVGLVASGNVSVRTAVARLLYQLHQQMTSSRTWLRLFSRDALFNLVTLAVTHAPPLDMEINTYHRVLQGMDDEPVSTASSSSHTYTSWAWAGLYARRIVFRILCDATTSPLLAAMKQYTGNSSQLIASSQETVGRVLARLLSVSHGVAVHHFVLHCLQEHPRCLPCLFQHLEVPDHKSTYEVVSMLNCINRCMRLGPVPELCRPHHDWSLLTLEELLILIHPVAIHGNYINKGLQNACSLLVAETVKYLMHLMRRAFRVVSALRQIPGRTVEMAHAQSTHMMGMLPNVQLLLSVLSRFGGSSKTKTGNPLLMGYVHDFLLLVYSHYPNYITEARYDWSKLLGTPDSFCSLSLVNQHKLLRFFEAILVNDNNKVRALNIMYETK